RLNVIADRPDRPIPLDRMGSGANWVGYHVVTHLALHQWFRQHDRPVPAFVFFDQPTQAYFPADRVPSPDEPPENWLSDEDRAAVQRLFALMFETAANLAPNLQLIVTEHANLPDAQFQSAIVENWRDGAALIPAEWITPS